MSNQKSIESAIKNLEVQVGQLAKQLANRPSTSFGANTEKNPKEECKAVMTKSKMVSMNEGEKRIGEEKQQLVTEPEIDPVMEPLSETEEEVEVEDDQQKEIPIINKYIHSENIIVEGNYSVVIQRILPPKHKDPGSLTIPCSIGEVSVGKALIDLGASINLMPLSLCRRLGELEIMPTRNGVIEDVLVQVKHLIFPADFVVMDIEEDTYIPLILGHPFMASASCAVDMGKKKLEMGIEDQKISFELFDE
ncbi:uncharacterized protein LOC114386069 [Glycine soja]|uniref:uncharacterized protein LOC114386069 n=1 Tax=Glycine soja TaxID=3848 RepID=UPI00103B4EF2|nr:uncharacterized protein LOC114386069 [Glycine soja]